MATTRNARAHWEGTLLEGQGTVELTSSGIGTYPSRGPRGPNRPTAHESRRAHRRRARVVLLDGALPRPRDERQSRDLAQHVGRSRLSARRRHHRDPHHAVRRSGELDARASRPPPKTPRPTARSPRPRRGADHVERRLRTFRQNNEWGSRRRGYNALRFATLRFIERRRHVGGYSLRLFVAQFLGLVASSSTTGGSGSSSRATC